MIETTVVAREIGNDEVAGPVELDPDGRAPKKLIQSL